MDIATMARRHQETQRKKSNMKIQSLNPATGIVEKVFDEYSSARVFQIIDAAQQCFDEYKTTSFAFRSQCLKRAAVLLSDGKNKYAELITLEMGKPIAEAIAEVEKCAWACNYYAENAEHFLADKEITTDASKSYVGYDPLGIILAIMPWNFPFWQVFRFAAPALMAGNTCLLKHAPNVPQCALAIEEIFKEAGFPDGAFASLLVDVPAVKPVIEDNRIQAITLTGSERAGAAVASLAGKNIKKTVLELGGSDPFIVLEDANLKEAATVAVTSRMLNTGQSCIAAKRFIVHKKIADQFSSLLVQKMEALKVGNPMDGDTSVGPLARLDLLEKLESQVEVSVQKGAEVLTGGNRVEGEGYFYQPTVLAGITSDMPVYCEEVFGPVAPIITVVNNEEAIHIANDSDYGLGASLWTTDLEKAQKMAKNIQSGAVFINGMVKSDPRLPFGGIKKSGYGRELSSEGIVEFVNIKTVWVK